MCITSPARNVSRGHHFRGILEGSRERWPIPSGKSLLYSAGAASLINFIHWSLPLTKGLAATSTAKNSSPSNGSFTRFKNSAKYCALSAGLCFVQVTRALNTVSSPLGRFKSLLLKKCFSLECDIVPNFSCLHTSPK